MLASHNGDAFAIFVEKYYLTNFFLLFFCLCRYLGKLKSNVRNKAHPEGSIAEAYLADECMTFCSRYIVGFETKHNLTSRNDDSEELVGHCDVTRRSTLFPHAGNPLGKPGNFVLRGLDKVQAHRYVLFNCSDVNSYLR
jgi:hypothetical protein